MKLFLVDLETEYEDTNARAIGQLISWLMVLIK